MTPRKPKGRPGPPKGEGGRPKADAAKVREGVRLVVEDDLTCEEAGEMVGLGGNTIRRAWKASLAAAEGGAIVVDAPAGGASTPSPPPAALMLPEGVAAAVFARPDPAKVASLRAMVTAADPATRVELGADFVGRLAAGEECSRGDVRAMLLEGAAEASLDALPYELAVERSIAVSELVLKEALEAHDWRSANDAKRDIDRLRFGKREPDPEGLTRAETLILMRRLVGALQGMPAAVEAVRRVLEEG